MRLAAHHFVVWPFVIAPPTFFHFNFGSEPDVDVSLASVDDDVVLFTEKERKNVFVPICRYNTELTPTIRKEAVCYV